MQLTEARLDVYRHKESNKLLFVGERMTFPSSDFNQAVWQLLICGTIAPLSVRRGLRDNPYYVTSIEALEKPRARAAA